MSELISIRLLIQYQDFLSEGEHSEHFWQKESMETSLSKKFSAVCSVQDPLNSGDDVSEQDIPEIFDTENVIVCQYDKVSSTGLNWNTRIPGDNVTL